MITRYSSLFVPGWVAAGQFPDADETALQSIAEEWGIVAATSSDSENDVRKTATVLFNTWSGDAAAAAHQQVTTVVKWIDSISLSAQVMQSGTIQAVAFVTHTKLAINNILAALASTTRKAILAGLANPLAVPALVEEVTRAQTWARAQIIHYNEALTSMLGALSFQVDIQPDVRAAGAGGAATPESSSASAPGSQASTLPSRPPATPIVPTFDPAATHQVQTINPDGTTVFADGSTAAGTAVSQAPTPTTSAPGTQASSAGPMAGSTSANPQTTAQAAASATGPLPGLPWTGGLGPVRPETLPGADKIGADSNSMAVEKATDKLQKDAKSVPAGLDEAIKKGDAVPAPNQDEAERVRDTITGGGGGAQRGSDGVQAAERDMASGSQQVNYDKVPETVTGGSGRPTPDGPGWGGQGGGTGGPSGSSGGGAGPVGPAGPAGGGSVAPGNDGGGAPHPTGGSTHAGIFGDGGVGGGGGGGDKSGTSTGAGTSFPQSGAGPTSSGSGSAGAPGGGSAGSFASGSGGAGPAGSGSAGSGSSGIIGPSGTGAAGVGAPIAPMPTVGGLAAMGGIPTAPLGASPSYGNTPLMGSGGLGPGGAAPSVGVGGLGAPTAAAPIAPAPSGGIPAAPASVGLSGAGVPGSAAPGPTAAPVNPSAMNPATQTQAVLPNAPGGPAATTTGPAPGAVMAPIGPAQQSQPTASGAGSQTGGVGPLGPGQLGTGRAGGATVEAAALTLGAAVATLGLAGAAAMHFSHLWSDLRANPIVTPRSGQLLPTQFGPNDQQTAVLPAGLSGAYQRVLLPGEAEALIAGQITTLRGLVHPLHQVQHLTTPAQLYAALGLGFPVQSRAGADTLAFDRDADSIEVLRFAGLRWEDLITPIEADVTVPFDTVPLALVRHHARPWTGTGEAPGSTSTAPIDEHEVLGYAAVPLPHLAEIWRIHADGTTEYVSTYNARNASWVGSTAPSRPAVGNRIANGAFATLTDGHVFEIVPLTDQYTLLVARGTAPDGFLPAQDGTARIQVANAQIRSVQGVTTIGLWQGLPVQLLERSGGAVLIDYAGDDASGAASAGFRQVNQGHWQPRWVADSEVSSVQTLERAYPPLATTVEALPDHHLVTTEPEATGAASFDRPAH